MEDQPADSGDLTTDADAAAEPTPPARRRRWFTLRRSAKTVAPEEVSTETQSTEPKQAKPVPRGKAARAGKTEAVEPETATEAEASEAAETEPAGAEAPEEEPAAEQVLVPHRPAGKRLAIAAIVAGVLFVGAAGFAGAMLQPYLTDRATVQIKLDVARTATEAITTLWTYTPDDMESLPDRSAGYLGGDFEHEYRKYIDAIVAPNKQAQVSNTTQVMGAAVETLTPTEATAIVYTNSVATSPVTKNIPSLRYLSYRLTMKRDDADWLITRMSTVTSLDLTPQL
ncbi:mammalian cell entry protein [Mycolicibacterium elephantis]|uniref:mammalian cell entry protein n=1 Tax=Mycolicibacterium elephantis TaxID=81858 RepID=UPI003A87C84A